jgi:hypothetical protein
MNTKFLTQEERNLIENFLRNGVLNSKIIKLQQVKMEELNNYLDARVPNTPVRWREFIHNNGIECPLENFLNTFSELIEESELPHLISLGARYPLLRDPRLSLLDDLDKTLNNHKYPCRNCPEK